MKWVMRISMFMAALEASIDGQVYAAPPTGPAVEVVTTYPLMPAESIERDITSRMERWASQAAGISQVESRTLEGVSIVRLHFRRDEKLDAALKQVIDLSLAAQPNLPPGTKPPVVRSFDPAEPPPVGLLVLSGDGFDEVEMKRLARQQVFTELQKIPGVAAPFIVGGKERVTQIFLDAAKLKARNLVPRDVIKILETNNKNLQDYQLDSKSLRAEIDAKMQQADWIIELRPAVKDPDKIGNLIIRSLAGGEIRLRDLAVLNDVAVPQTEIAHVDGRREICIPVGVAPGADAAAVSKALRAALPGIERKLPNKTQLRYLLDRADAARQITVLLRAPSGSLADTEELVVEVERFLSANIPANQRTAVFSDIGCLEAAGFRTYSAWNTGPRDATIRVQLSEKATGSAADIAARLRHQVALEKRFGALSAWFQAGAAVRPPVRVRLKGKDLQALMATAPALLKQAAKARGAADVLIALSPATPMLTISVDREKSAALGLKPIEILRQAATIFGSPAESLDIIGNQITIPAKPDIRVDEALNTPVSAAKTKGAAPLRVLIQVRRSVMPLEITHVDFEPVIDIWVNVEAKPAAEVARAVAEQLQGVRLPPGVCLKVSVD